jgi:hypothetical protein
MIILVILINGYRVLRRILFPFFPFGSNLVPSADAITAPAERGIHRPFPSGASANVVGRETNVPVHDLRTSADERALLGGELSDELVEDFGKSGNGSHF